MELRLAMRGALRSAPISTSALLCRPPTTWLRYPRLASPLFQRKFSTSWPSLAPPPRNSNPAKADFSTSTAKENTATGEATAPTTADPTPYVRPPPSLPQSWANRLRSRSPVVPTPSKPDPASSNDPADFPRLINWDANEFMGRSFAGGPSAVEKMRLRPSTGRTVKVGGNVDVARSFTLLNILVRKNRVAQDFNRQRFHERPGLKRKRLRRERWRKRFKTGFIANIDRVLELKKQGW